MDSTNNPIPNQNTSAGAAPVPPVEPGSSLNPDNNMLTGESPTVGAPVQGGAEAPVTSSVPDSQAFQSFDNASKPSSPRVTIPVSSPSGESASVQPTPVPASAPQPVSVPTPVHPVINPSMQDTLGASLSPSNQVGATDPIMMPDSGSSVDPVEKELNAPMKAADPVPGSIGSAVSGPEDTAGAAASPFVEENSPKSVSFNDPATPVTEDSEQTSKTKKKSNKTTLIALIIVAVMIIIALVGVLIFQIMNGGGGQPGSGGGSGSVITDNPDNPGTSGGGSGTVVGGGNVNLSIICKIEATEDTVDDRIKEQKAVFKVVNNKLTEAELSVTFINENGESETMSESASLEEMISAFGQEDEYIASDGTLKATPEVFAGKLSEVLTESDSDNTYTCAVEESN